MNFTRCDTCKKEFEEMDEHVSKQNVAIHINVETGRRDFDCEFWEGDFCSSNCAAVWLHSMKEETGY